MCSKFHNLTVILFGIFISTNLQSCCGKNQNDNSSQDVIEALGMVLPQHFRRNINCSVHDRYDKNNNIEKDRDDICDLISSRVFSSRRKDLDKARKYILKQNSYYDETNKIVTNLPKRLTNYSINISNLNRISYRKSRHRVKRDRTLLAVQEAEPKNNKLWPKWCKKLAYFRVFQYDYTLCLYIQDFRDDPILSYSDPHLGVTSYGYGSRKSFDDIGNTAFCNVYRALEFHPKYFDS